MDVNEEAIRLVVKELESDLTKWEQAAYIDAPIKSRIFNGEVIHLMDTTFCQTTFCIAGMAIHQAGYLLDEELDVYTESGQLLGYVETVAADLLGLDIDQSVNIFHGSAGDGDFTKMKKVITRETGVTFDE